MSQVSDPHFAEALNRLWEKYLPQIEERVSILQQAAGKLASGELTPEEQQKAAAEAHKLAGVLGTFGLQQGTDLAREAERLCESSVADLRPLSAQLAAIAGQLHSMIAGRTSSAG